MSSSSQSTQFTFYTRPGSNNSLRIHLWLSLHPAALPSFTFIDVAHADQSQLADNPAGKIPLLRVRGDGNRWEKTQSTLTSTPTPTSILTLTETAAIIMYLERLYQSSSLPPVSSLLPDSPFSLALSDSLVRKHDLYIASPNALFPLAEPRINTHTQSCLYVPPPPAPGRNLDIETRHAKLMALLKALWMVEEMLGDLRRQDVSLNSISIVHINLYPTLLYAEHYLRRTMSWSGAPWEILSSAASEGLPLRSWPCTTKLLAACRADAGVKILGDRMLTELANSNRVGQSVDRIREDLERDRKMAAGVRVWDESLVELVLGVE